jgi:AraC-like DNA-binding protein
MSRNGQKRPTVVPLAEDFADGAETGWHDHEEAQLVFAASGVMTVRAAAGLWVVPPQRAVWMPARMPHSIRMSGRVAMRTLYLAPRWRAGLPSAPVVLQVSPLMRELILRVALLNRTIVRGEPAARLVDLVLDELRPLAAAPLDLALPRDRRARRIADALLADPADERDLADWAVAAGGSVRTLARLFVRDTGMSFGAWRQQLRLQRALERLAAGRSVTAVALDLGYESPSAFIAMFRRAMGTTPGRYFRTAR